MFLLENKKYLVLIAIALFVVGVDQLTKTYIHTAFTLGESVGVIKDFFSITYVRNEGAAFGFLNEASFRRVFFLIIPVLAMMLILFMLHGVPQKDKVQILALSSIFGGALGNYIDRLKLGFVVDFLDFHWKDVYSFPAFNVADMAIVCGVAVLMLLIVIETKQERLAKKKSS